MATLYASWPALIASSVRFTCFRQAVNVIPDAGCDIGSHKSLNHFGQAHCRLSRDQSILDAEPSRTYWLSSSLSRILFGVPASFVDRFERLYLDTMVYTTDFREFFGTCQEDRRLFINLSFGAIL